MIVRFGTEFLLNAHVPLAEALRVPLLAASFALLLVALWANRGYPGMSLAFIGVLANAVVILVNGGYMPIYLPSLLLAGLHPADVTTSLHTIMPPALDASFLLHLGPFADVIPIPFPIIQNVASIGDVFLTLGLAFFLFAAVVRVPQELDEAELAAIRTRLDDLAASGRPLRAGDPGAETGLSPALTGAVALERPLVLGSAGTGMASPSLSTFEADAVAPGSVTVTIPLPSIEAVERVRQHPYVRLALNGSFSALWAGQLISLFGDRLNQIALVAVVAITTGSALATGLVFFAATLPNLLLSPIAGAFVDRWDRKEVMVVSDLLRAALVLLLPVAAVTNILLVYPLIFLVTTISVFFRPARVAILPADRPGGGPPERELRDVGRRDHRRRHRLPARRRVRRAPRLARSRWRSGSTARPTSRRPRCSARSWSTRPPVRAAAAEVRAEPRCRDDRRLAVPAPRDGPARQHPAGGGRPVQPRHLHRPDADRSSRPPSAGRASAGRPRTASSRPGSGSATSSAGSPSDSSARASRRAGWSSPATWRWAS